MFSNEITGIFRSNSHITQYGTSKIIRKASIIVAAASEIRKSCSTYSYVYCSSNNTVCLGPTTINHLLCILPLPGPKWHTKALPFFCLSISLCLSFCEIRCKTICEKKRVPSSFYILLVHLVKEKLLNDDKRYGDDDPLRQNRNESSFLLHTSSYAALF